VVTELKLPEVNRVLLSGRLTRDPDGRFANDGTAITQLDVAFHRRYRTREGTPAEQTGFVTVMTYQRTAEVCSQYLRKGSAVLIEGRLQMREWATPQGAKRQRLEVRADLVHFLERPQGRPDAGGEDPNAQPAEGELF
jgi:single-strand DNA-binding protein